MPPPPPKTVTMIRHGRSLANEYLSSLDWGAPGFQDASHLRDSPLSPFGVKQAEALSDRLRAAFPDPPSTAVLVSPLTRTLSTMELALAGGAFPGAARVATPELAERVYMSADLGTPASELRGRHPGVEFGGEEEWWWRPGEGYEEWRPSGGGQRYACEGEVEGDFLERMGRLVERIGEREEEHVVLVSSWGVLRELTGRDDIGNCEVIGNVPFEEIRERVMRKR
ncbi:hypothetical protein TeGR_g13208 [Tetraparma gracilis]|uniref:Phosphoglycerate mutase-like protein n=1 Tax=Tetraparma gracilis TaxID=2962635 RepID=A0ABQ6MJ47_9STRA|nr:hypothetical protein TeGR_g13208 [Tetraparma gracilis]